MYLLFTYPVKQVLYACIFFQTLPKTDSQQAVLECYKSNEEKKRKWDKEAPQSVLRDTLWTHIFMSTGLSTQFLTNKDVKDYHEMTDAKYALPGMFFLYYINTS